MILFPILMFFLVVLNDGLRCGIVDSEFLSDLSDKIDMYIDYTPPLLNASQQFCFSLLSNFFVFLCGLAVFNVDRLHVVENKFYFGWRGTGGLYGLDLSTHQINNIIKIILWSDIIYSYHTYWLHFIILASHTVLIRQTDSNRLTVKVASEFSINF